VLAQNGVWIRYAVVLAKQMRAKVPKSQTKIKKMPRSIWLVVVIQNIQQNRIPFDDMEHR
jgi:hypothetical protein